MRPLREWLTLHAEHSTAFIARVAFCYAVGAVCGVMAALVVIGIGCALFVYLLDKFFALGWW